MYGFSLPPIVSPPLLIGFLPPEVPQSDLPVVTSPIHESLAEGSIFMKPALHGLLPPWSPHHSEPLLREGSYYLVGTCCVLGESYNFSPQQPHGVGVKYPQFTDEETENHWDSVAHPWLFSYKVGELGFQS